MDLDNLNLVDEQGNTLSLKPLDGFVLNEKQYVIMMDPNNINAEGGASVYVLQMIMNDKDEMEFVAPTEEDLPEVVKKATEVLNEQSSFSSGCTHEDCSHCSGCGHQH